VSEDNYISMRHALLELINNAFKEIGELREEIADIKKWMLEPRLFYAKDEHSGIVEIPSPVVTYVAKEDIKCGDVVYLRKAKPGESIYLRNVGLVSLQNVWLVQKENPIGGPVSDERNR